MFQGLVLNNGALIIRANKKEDEKMKRCKLIMFSIVATVLLCGSLVSLVQATDDVPKEIAPIYPERERPLPEDGVPIYDGELTPFYDGNATDLDEPVYTTQGTNTLTSADDIELDSSVEQEGAARLSAQNNSSNTLPVVAGVLVLLVAVVAIGVVYRRSKPTVQ